MASAVSHSHDACRAVLRSAATADQTTPATGRDEGEEDRRELATFDISAVIGGRLAD